MKMVKFESPEMIMKLSTGTREIVKYSCSSNMESLRIVTVIDLTEESARTVNNKVVLLRMKSSPTKHEEAIKF